MSGLWEICRDDEQLPREVAVPIAELPQAPCWRAIPVPGDKNTLRPDFEMAHRVWYRTRVNVPASLAGRSFQIVFPQNNLNTTVYVNGVLCGFDKNPFARVQIDVTKAMKPGAVNELWVGIRDAWYAYSTNPEDPLKLRKRFNLPIKYSHDGFQDLAYPVWNHFQSGILQTPELVAAGGVYAADVFCKPSVSRQALAAEVTVANPSSAKVEGELRWEAVDDGTGAVAKAFPAGAFAVDAGAQAVVNLAAPWAEARLWWPDEPVLYRLRTTLVVGGQTVDVKETTFGFREWSWAGPDFRLNGVVWHGWADCHTAGSKEDWLAFYRRTNQTVMRFWGTTWQGLGPEAALDFLDRSGVVCRRSGVLDGEAIGYFAIENDPVLKTQYNSEIKMQLMENWRDQIVAQVKGERNHPSVMIWSIENEWLYINCINLYGGLMDQFEKVVTDVANAVQAADPTRPVMVDGGGATKAQTLPVHGDHYVVGSPTQYPDLAYEANPKGGGRGRWEWDQKRPRFLGEDFYMTGNHPEVSYFEGEGAFAGKPRRGVALWYRMLQEGYRWAGYGAWHLWLGQHDTDQSQYLACAARAVLCRQWNWTFGSGEKVKRTFGVFNDTRYADPITFAWALTVGGKQVARDAHECQVSPGAHQVVEAVLPLPEATARDEGELVLTLAVQGREVFRDVKAVSVLPPAIAQAGLTAGSLAVFDPEGPVRAFLEQQQVGFTSVEDLDALPTDARVLVVGPDALDATESTSSRLAAYGLGGGRRVVVLEQANPLRFQGLPADVGADSNQGYTAFAEDPEHPVLHGLAQKDFFTWGPGVPVYRNAYRKPGRGATSLIQCGAPLDRTALAEVPVGEGLLLLCQLTVGSNLAGNATARRVLLNLLSYAGSYRLEFSRIVAVTGDAPELTKVLDAIGLQYEKLDDPVAAMRQSEAKVAVISASPANLAALAAEDREGFHAAAATQVEGFTRSGGSLVLCGLTPEGLESYNRIVGVDHMIRPGKRERVLFPTVRDRLTAGLTTADIVLYSSERIFSWTAGNYVVSDLFSYVVDYDEVASFGKSPFFAYDNITNGFVSADGWPLIINFPHHQDNAPYDVPIALQKPQAIREFTWVGNVFYYPQTRVNLIFDGDREHPASFRVEPNAEPQTFAIEPPRPASEVTLQIAEWTPLPDKAPNIGIDNIYLKAQRPPEFHQCVKPMLNLGGLMHYPRGPGRIVLCNVRFRETEDVPENVGKRRAILAAILRNLKAPFSGGRLVIAGADLVYTPVDLSKQATQFRDERGWFGDQAFTFKDMPAGTHTFAGVTYSLFEFATSPVPTVVMLGGSGVPNNPPEKVTGIPLNRRADALFFLHTARIDQRRNDQEQREGKRYEMARYVVTYADGQTATIPVCAEIDIEDWRQDGGPRAIPGAQVAWSRPYPDSGRCAVAYSLQWTNTRPDAEIASVGLEYGPDRRGVPVLLALTAATAAK
jgi:beta-galactosidase